MCNLSTGIEEKATEKFILNMYKKGYTLDQIADVEETSVAAVEAVIKKKEPAMAQATSEYEKNQAVDQKGFAAFAFRDGKQFCIWCYFYAVFSFHNHSRNVLSSQNRTRMEK